MDAVKLHAVAAFAAGLIITLFLAAYLTPRTWWRRPNARALCIMLAGAWGFGSLILYAVHGPVAMAAEPPPVQVQVQAAQHAAGAPPAASVTPAAGQLFRVHRDLNLRAAPGVQAARVTIVTSGSEVVPTGVHDGDWWQIKTIIDDTETTGWVNSLWLRRSGE